MAAAASFFSSSALGMISLDCLNFGAPPVTVTATEPAIFFGTDKTAGETSSRTPVILYSNVVSGDAAFDGDCPASSQNRHTPEANNRAAALGNVRRRFMALVSNALL